ncbi:FGGY family carbohydrate kinase [Methylobacter sp. YRD-M1]|uniref:FGGY family carbohydrate kinase n=1 Tax=Methylobacter sp. YRD-M1 TaxID=2911520 RepID=UPI00227A1EB2|nr:FGGY family carbohydrate kinase [Methylobacter sp. YRD-M1]WAK00961.1 carbohydrate kinase [Methylobacter sp. YRD-M1]
MAASLIPTIALDLGTTALKAGILADNGEFAAVLSRPAPTTTGENGICESDALIYLATATELLDECLADAGGNARLGLSCQRSSFLIWDKISGLPVTPLISWQDTRGEACCKALRAQEPLIKDLTGLRLTPYYFAPKLRILLEDHPPLREGLEQGELIVGMLDCFLIYHWSGGNRHQTDVSMAARTLLMDVRLAAWSPILCDLFGIPLNWLPAITPSSGLNLTLKNGCTLQADIADQSAALIASIRPDSAEALVNLGTGGFVVRYLPEQEPVQTDGYLQTLVYKDNASKTRTAIEGTINSIAAALAPYPYQNCRLEDLAETAQLFCICEPSGLGAPYFRELSDIVFSAPVDHLDERQIACLLLEGIIFRVTRILDDFRRSYGVDRVYLSGGLSEVPALQQGIAACSPVEVHSLQQKEASLLGAAILAADLPPAYARKSVKVSSTDNALKGKYQHWKTWFDAFLNT